MEFFNSLNLTQIKGGTKLKQGDLGSVLSYSLTDENGQEITSFDTKTAYINLVLDDKIWFTTTTLVDISRVTFRIDKAIPIGLYYLEIKIDDYIFPSDRDSIILIEEGSTPYDLKELVPNYDINMTIKGILSDLSQKGIDISDLNRRLAEKVNKDEVTNVMTPKGTLAYASLPTSGNQVGWYYYCPDGDGTHGAGNYVWNGTSWFFGGTGDEGYNLLKKDIENRKVVPMTSIDPYKMNLDKYDVRITEGKYLTGRNTTSHTPTMTQDSNYEYDIIDIAINPNNTTITVPYDTAQSAGQAFVLYTEGLYSNNATPDNVNKNQIGVIGVGDNSYTVNLHVSPVKYERVAFTVPKGRRDFYFQNYDEGDLGKLIDNKIYKENSKIVSNNIVIAPVNMFYSIGAIGDSYTAGSALSSDGVTWQDVTELSWIATMAKRAGIYYSNYGKGGATTKSYITDKLPTVLSGQAKDLYFIALGINDYLQNLTVGTVADIKDDYTQNGESYYGWYGSIISQVQAHAPKAKIVLVKIWTNETAKIPYDNAITQIASHFELPVIDPYDDAFFNSSLYLDNMVSGHPTPMTYPCMGLAMERLFSRCVIENPDYFKFATIG